ncbi:hypothetical protein MNBD_ALPHA07-1867 [hydrothermal vent metagenome]|uniref:Zinc ABC transporter, periplasmic-binding protein ZnuA n=1 Tax=hydrothermal vent metagenome TaxID=652676 RepID=A0A3B0RZE9_9ZZZZ
MQGVGTPDLIVRQGASPHEYALRPSEAAAGVAELDRVMGGIEQALTPLRGLQYLVYHDDTQYFERRFNLPALGAVTGGEAAMPGPARIADLREFVAQEGLTCLMSDPQSDPRLARAIFPQGIKTGVLDVMGSDKSPAAGLYPALLRELAHGYEACE